MDFTQRIVVKGGIHMEQTQVAAATESPPPPEGARCAFHPLHTAKQTCERCGTFTCLRCYEFGDRGQALCRPCLAKTPFLADRVTRLVAALIDGLLVVITMMLAAVTGFFIRRANPGMQPISPLLGFIGVGCVFCTQIVFLVRHGQSIGKRLMGIRVVRTDGHPASVLRIVLLRNVTVYLIGLVTNALLPGVFFLVDSLCIYGGERRCFHDFIADTVVVKVPPVTSKPSDLS
jgi:uncharacterized RDD family membrane protein YckC